MKSLGWWTQSINSRLSRQKDPHSTTGEKNTHTHTHTHNTVPG